MTISIITALYVLFQTPHSARWLSRYESGYCLPLADSTHIVSSISECIPICLMHTEVCYGLSFNPTSGECKISSSDSVEACNEANVNVYVSSVPSTTTTTSTSTTSTSTTTTTVQPTTTLQPTTAMDHHTTTVGNSPSYPAINIGMIQT